MKLKNKQRGSKRDKILSIVTVASIILVLVLNLLITHVGHAGSFYVDITSEGLYSLTDAMKRECDFIDKLDTDDRCVKITFCADPDTLMASEITRVTYFMALKLAARYDNLEVETVNAEYNPTALAQYKSTSLKTINQSDVIVSYGERYRIVSANRFWVTSGGNLWSYNGEYRMATLIKSVTSVNRPVAYFVTGHGETHYDAANPESEMSQKSAAIYDLIEERDKYGANDVVPGLTGWAQVNGYRGDTSIEKRIECDLYYIENWSAVFDIKIMLMFNIFNYLLFLFLTFICFYPFYHVLKESLIVNKLGTNASNLKKSVFLPKYLVNMSNIKNGILIPNILRKLKI